MEQFTKALAHELAGRGITVNTVSPGVTETDLLPSHLKEARAQLSPFQRVGPVLPTGVLDFSSRFR